MVIKTTYFQFNGKIYEQTYGMSMGSPLSPVLSNLFMEEFEKKALSTAPHPPKYWGRYVDDTGVIGKKAHEDELFDHINKQHESIKFTIEKENDDQCLPMLDLEMIRKDNSITTNIYRKPTHTDHYLQWSSHHPVHQKLGVVRTLMHRADTLIADDTLRKEEKEKVKTALRACGYPEWALKEGDLKGKKEKKKEAPEDGKKPKGYVVIPYAKGISERLRRVYRKHGISMYSKAGLTLRNCLVRPKDPVEAKEQCGVVYECACDECGQIYVGETGRSLGERASEHQTSIESSDWKSALSQHQEQTGHLVNHTHQVQDKIKIIDKEPRDLSREIVEAIHIRLRKATINRTEGYNLPDVYLPILKEAEARRGGH